MYFKVETYSSSDLYIQVQSEMALICKVLNCLLHMKNQLQSHYCGQL